MASRSSRIVLSPGNAGTRIPKYALRGFWEELDRRGVASRELEHLSGVQRPRADDFVSAISEDEMHALFAAGAELTGDARIGLAVGRAIGAASFHLLGHLVLASATLQQSLAFSVRAEPQLARKFPTLEQRADRMQFGVASAQACTTGALVEADLTAVIVHDVALPFLDSRFGPPALEFAYAAPADTSVYRSFFAGQVSFACAGTYCVFPRRALLQRRSGTDMSLFRKLFDLAQDQYSAAPVDDDWAEAVRRALRAHTAPRLVDLDALAAQLGVSQRGLARRLGRQGWSLSGLLDEALYERAQHLLKRPGITASEVAEALGYAELSSFFRAYRRWSGGKTPKGARD